MGEKEQEQIVSSDPGNAIMHALRAELDAKMKALDAWRGAERQLWQGHERWKAVDTETGRWNAGQYAAALARVRLELKAAGERAELSRSAITMQQTENLRDYRQRVAMGLAE